MSLYQAVAGSRILAADMNQYYNLLKGAAGEGVTLINNTAGGLVFQPSSDPAATTEFIQIKNNAGTVRLAIQAGGSIDMKNGDLLFNSKATGIIYGGSSQTYFNNAAGDAQNIVITDAGAVTIRSTLVVSGVSVTIGAASGGKLIAAGTLTAGGLLASAVQVATSGPLIYSGSGAPSISAAVKGSLYLRSDGSGTGDRAYIAKDTAGTWAAITTAS